MISTRLPERSPTTNSYPSLVGSMVMNDMVPSSFLREATALFHSPKSKVVAPFLLSTSIVPSSLLVYPDAGIGEKHDVALVAGHAAAVMHYRNGVGAVDRQSHAVG